MSFPPADTRFPITLPDGSTHEGTVFLRAVVDHPRIAVGEFTYASTRTPTDDWAERIAPYLYPDSPERLIIGKFCQFADQASFVTASANHRYDGFSSYPFAVMDHSFDRARPSMPDGGPDTVVGHDVWLGRGVTVLPGARIGNGVIVGAGAVVGGEVPDYAIVAGNPGRIQRMRFDAGTIARLLDIAWWDWPIEHILAHEAAICGGDLTALEAAARAAPGGVV